MLYAGMGFTPGEKIALARSRMGPKGWSQADLATKLEQMNALGLDARKWRSRLANYEANRPVPSEKPLRCIADAMGISMGWFYDSESRDPIFKGDPVDGPALASPMPSSPTGRVTMIYAGEVPCSTSWGDPLSSSVPIDMDARFSGSGRYVCRVVNDSMYPALREGDLTIWQHDLNPPFGTIVLAQRKGDHACTAKLLRFDSTTMRPVLLPLNPQHDSPEDGDGWGAIARLVGVERVIDGFERAWKLDSGLRPKHLLGED